MSPPCAEHQHGPSQMAGQGPGPRPSRTVAILACYKVRAVGVFSDSVPRVSAVTEMRERTTSSNYVFHGFSFNIYVHRDHHSRSNSDRRKTPHSGRQQTLLSSVSVWFSRSSLRCRLVKTIKSESNETLPPPGATEGLCDGCAERTRTHRTLRAERGRRRSIRSQKVYRAHARTSVAGTHTLCGKRVQMRAGRRALAVSSCQVSATFRQVLEKAIGILAAQPLAGHEPG